MHQFQDVELLVGCEFLQVDAVLEEIGVQRTLRQRQIGLHIIIELHQLDLVALFFQDGHDTQLELVDVRAGRAAYHQFLLGLGLHRGREAHQGDCSHGRGQQGTTHHKILHRKPLSKKEKTTPRSGTQECPTPAGPGRQPRLSRRRAAVLPTNCRICTITTSTVTVSTITSVWKR
ncbi:hypothetical protein D3C78_1447310 [compost metagenome]